MSLRVWKTNGGESLRVIKKQHQNSVWHEAPIICFSLHHEKPFVISGDLSGQVFCSNYETGEIGGLFPHPHSDSVECIEFCRSPASPYCVSCSMDNKINVYDVSSLGTTNSLRQSIRATDPGCGITKVKFSAVPDQTHILFASSTNGSIVQLDIRNGTILSTYRGHAGPINSFVEIVSEAIHWIATAGDDKKVNIYDLSKPSPSWQKHLENKEQKKGLKVSFE